MSKHEAMADIEKIIQKASIDGALTEDAIHLFNGHIEANKELELENEKLKERVSGHERTIELLQQERDEARAVRDHQAEMLKNIDEREKACMKMEVEKECAEKRVEDHQNMVGLIFRNAVIKRSVLGQELVAIPGTPDEIDQYGNRNYGSGRPPEATGVPVEKTETSTEE